MSGRTILILKEALALAAWLLLVGTALANSSGNYRSTSNPRTDQPRTPVATPRVRLAVQTATRPVSRPLTIVVRVPGSAQAAVAATSASPRTVVVHTGESLTFHFSAPVSQAGSGPLLITEKRP